MSKIRSTKSNQDKPKSGLRLRLASAWRTIAAHKLYRDFWLFAITVVLFFAVKSNYDIAQTNKRLISDQTALLAKIQEGRGAAVRESCTTDQILVDIDRRILLDALARAKARGRVAEARRAKRFYNRVLEPLGGLKLLPVKTQNEQCDQRVERAVAPPPPKPKVSPTPTATP